MCQRFDGERPTVVPIVVKRPRHLGNNRASCKQFQIPEIRLIMKTEILIGNIAPADNGNTIVDYHRLVVHAVIEAVELGVPAPVLSLALAMRFASQGKGDYAAKQLAQLRRSFGGHAVQAAGKRKKS